MDLNEFKLYDLKNVDREFIKEKVTKAKFRLLRLFGQGHNIVIYIRKLNARTNYFRKLVKRMIPMDNRTR
jgi:hypothetical protein